MSLTDEDKQWIDDRLDRLETRLLTEIRQRSQYPPAIDSDIELLVAQSHRAYETESRKRR